MVLEQPLPNHLQATTTTTPLSSSSASPTAAILQQQQLQHSPSIAATRPPTITPPPQDHKPPLISPVACPASSPVVPNRQLATANGCLRPAALNMPTETGGLHPTAALQLYAAAAQLAPGGVRVPPWSPFLQFGVPGVFAAAGAGGPFGLVRPRFEPSAGQTPQNAAAQMASNAFANLTANLNAMRNASAAQTSAAAAVATAAIQHRLMIGNRQSMPATGPPSEGSNDDAGKSEMQLDFLKSNFVDGL